MFGQETNPKAIQFGPAVSLTYDGADPSHLEVALPCLTEHGIRGTFYVTETGLLDNPKAWIAAQNAGHEVGCHSLFEAADPFGNLPKWTLENVEEDLADARKLIEELLPGQKDFSFAYPGPESLSMTLAYEPLPTPYRPVVDRLFQVARSSLEGLVEASECDIRYLESIDASDLSLDDLIAGAEAAIFSGRWAIFAFRGIGSGEGAIDVASHRALCAWLQDHADVVRSGPVFDLAIELKNRRTTAALQPRVETD